MTYNGVNGRSDQIIVGDPAAIGSSSGSRQRSGAPGLELPTIATSSSITTADSRTSGLRACRLCHRDESACVHVEHGIEQGAGELLGRRLPCLPGRPQQPECIDLEAVAQPSQRREGDVHVRCLYLLEQTRRHAALLGRFLLRPLRLPAEPHHVLREPTLEIEVAGVSVLIGSICTAPFHRRRDRRRQCRY